MSLPGKVARAALRRARSAAGRLDARLAPWAARGGVRATLYYALFSNAFTREFRAVLAGRAWYARHARTAGGAAALLRRNSHRIEKGLLMRPLRPVFALDYLGETVAAYERALGAAGPAGGTGELCWAHDVLTRYFEVTAPHPATDPWREKFAALPWTFAAVERSIPRRRDLSSPPPVDIDSLEALARRRRSVRWFLPRPVPREAIDRAMAVAAQAPSACNRQPFVFRVLDAPDWVRRIAPLPFGTAGYEHNIPVLIVIVGRLGDFFSERDRHVLYIDGSLAAMSFLLAAEAQGLATCCINWPDVPAAERALAAALALRPDERAVMCLALGYPDPEGEVASSPKKPLDQLRRYNDE